MTAVLGIDPGVNGGLALLRADGAVAHVQGLRPEMTQIEVVAFVRVAVVILKAHGSSVCYIEKVQHMTGDGGGGSFTFGGINSLLRGALLMAEIVPRDVYPMAWQAAKESLTGGDKNISKARAIELFPGQKITHAVADALLIAEYGRRRMAAAAAQST